MLRTLNAQPTLWDMILPEQCLGLPPGLAEVDRLLDDERFFEPFRPFFDPRIGRPSIPMETYVRLMFLRFRYRLGYETLCAEVTDSLAWRRFCRIPLGERVPHPSTVEKTTEMGEPFVSLFVRDEIDELIRRHGFDQILHFGPQEALATYFDGRTDLEIAGAQRLVAATVATP